ncbi:MAG: hypothetical protein WBG17_03520 [Burkholderiaceae bacterium]
MLVLLPLAAPAQSIEQRPHPADASVAVPAPGYASAFDRYQPLMDEPVPPHQLWRDANHQVAAQADHNTHTADHAAPDPAPAAPMKHHGHH